MWEFQKGWKLQEELEEPIAVETKLWWVLSSPLRGKEPDSKQEVVVNFVAQDSIAIARDSLESTIGKLWDLESLGIKTSDKVHKSFENDISFIDGRYLVKFPWKQGHKPLPNNYANRLSCMKAHIKRLKREPEVLKEYDSIIKDQLRSGINKRVAELEGVYKVHCYLARLSLNKMSTVIGWFLVKCPWSNSNVSRSG